MDSSQELEANNNIKQEVSESSTECCEADDVVLRSVCVIHTETPKKFFVRNLGKIFKILTKHNTVTNRFPGISVI